MQHLIADSKQLINSFNLFKRRHKYSQRVMIINKSDIISCPPSTESKYRKCNKPWQHFELIHGVPPAIMMITVMAHRLTTFHSVTLFLVTCTHVQSVSQSQKCSPRHAFTLWFLRFFLQKPFFRGAPGLALTNNLYASCSYHAPFNRQRYGLC